MLPASSSNLLQACNPPTSQGFSRSGLQSNSDFNHLNTNGQDSLLWNFLSKSLHLSVLDSVLHCTYQSLTFFYAPTNLNALKSLSVVWYPFYLITFLQSFCDILPRHKCKFLHVSISWLCGIVWPSRDSSDLSQSTNSVHLFVINFTKWYLIQMSVWVTHLPIFIPI